MAVATVSSKGWVVIPVALRRKYDLQPGKQVVIVDYGNMLAVLPLMQNPVENSVGLLKGDASLTDALREARLVELAHGR